MDKIKPIGSSIDPLKKVIDQLLAAIVEIPGGKILTLCNPEDVYQIDVDAKGQFGYIPYHEILFRMKLRKSLEEDGGLIIRQFLDVRTKRTVPSGEEMWIPEKNLYGITLIKGQWFGISAENLQQCCETDAETGQPLPREDGVHYKSFEIHSENYCSQ